MAEKKKDKSAEFARDKSAFAKGGSEKGIASQKAQHKHSGTHQPRDANDISRDAQKKEQSETFGQNVQKSGQSAKRRNKKQYQKQDTFGHSDQKSGDMDADSKKKSDFSQDNDTFTEDGNSEQEEHQQKDDYHRRDTYHQSEKKGKYHRREYQNRERTKQSDFERDFQTKDKTFTEGAEPEFHGSKKLDRLQSKAEKAGKKTEAARKKIPKKKEYIHEFNNTKSLAVIGNATTEMCKPLLMEIGRTIGSYERQIARNKAREKAAGEYIGSHEENVGKGLANAPEADFNALKRESETAIEKPKETENNAEMEGIANETDIRKERGLSDSEPDSGRGAGTGTDQVRTDEEELSEGTQERDLCTCRKSVPEGEAGSDESKGCWRRYRKVYATKGKGKRRNLIR